MSKLSQLELEAYKGYQELYYGDNINNFDIFDVVEIDGDKQHLGIVKSFSGVDNYVYVMRHSVNCDRYWVAGFEETQLTKSTKTMDEVDVDLKNALIDWMCRNDFALAGREFKSI